MGTRWDKVDCRAAQQKRMDPGGTTVILQRSHQWVGVNQVCELIGVACITIFQVVTLGGEGASFIEGASSAGSSIAGHNAVNESELWI